MFPPDPERIDAIGRILNQTIKVGVDNQHHGGPWIVQGVVAYAKRRDIVVVQHGCVHGPQIHKMHFPLDDARRRLLVPLCFWLLFDSLGTPYSLGYRSWMAISGCASCGNPYMP